MRWSILQWNYILTTLHEKLQTGLGVEMGDTHEQFGDITSLRLVRKESGLKNCCTSLVFCLCVCVPLITICFIWSIKCKTEIKLAFGVKSFKNMRLFPYLPSQRCRCCCDSSGGLSRSCAPTPTSGTPAPNRMKDTNNILNAL